MIKRLLGWWLHFAALLAVISFVAPQQVPVLAFKLLMVVLATMVAYYADRSLYRHAIGIGLDLPPNVLGAARLLSRALIFLGVLLALAIGV